MIMTNLNNNRKFRIHVLGVPHTRTNLDYTACAYTQKAYKFCKMMYDRGHYVIHYGVEGSDPECNENVVVVSNEIYNKVYGNYDYHSNFFQYNTEDECYQTFYKNAIAEINKRKEPGDIILPFWGFGVKPICDVFPDLITIEPGIGYGSGSWANYRVFESYAIYHAYCGTKAIESCCQNNYDVVIPNYFDPKDFLFNGSKDQRLKGIYKDGHREEPYFLYVGRVYNGKGVYIAIQVAECLGVKLKIAGQLGDEYKIDFKEAYNGRVEYVGYVGAKERTELMRNAIASFLPSQYVEPFGGVQIENLLCGTPTITSDWGAFAENNINGVTGYRCRTFEDYIKAGIHVLNGDVPYRSCRKYGMKFSLENIAPKYEKFFNDVLNLYQSDEGWSYITPKTKELMDKIRRENLEGKI